MKRFPTLQLLLFFISAVAGQDLKPDVKGIEGEGFGVNGITIGGEIENGYEPVTTKAKEHNEKELSGIISNTNDKDFQCIDRPGTSRSSSQSFDEWLSERVAAKNKNQGGRRLHVFSPDNRLQLSASRMDTYPYRTFGRLYFTNPSGNFVCSTGIIQRELAITNRHCIPMDNNGN
mmetsp:Transcript_14822/g.17376  ORF Transcript_14822/g.17376 Transcript_14822/m.17376 type:complete len:175 (+) Transcript_14822:196-720(+)